MGAAPHLNFAGNPYMPLNLKGVLMRHGLTQPGWAAAVTQTNKRPLSEAAASLLINWGNWPKNTPAESIRQQTEAWLLTHGVPEAELAGLWSVDGGDTSRYLQPSGIHLGQASGRRLKLVEPEFEPMEIAMLSPAAKRHFKLFRDPFQDDVNSPEDVFFSAEQRYVMEAMWQTAKHGGFIAVSGESGSGKSTLRKMLVERMRDQPIRMIFPRALDKTRLTTGAICQAIINDIAPGETVRSSLEAQARQVEKLLLESARADYSHVLVIEEAHDLTIQTLKYLKRFYELEDGFKKLMSIILIGQTELKEKLDERRHPEAREVIRRCEIAELLPLNAALEEYLAHKFKRVGVDPASIFAADAYDAIRARWTKSKPGVKEVLSQLYPLVVNNTVTRAMNRAAEIGVPVIGGDLIREL
jgi:type II secretory pathway predicted ATPase ExeA